MVASPGPVKALNLGELEWVRGQATAIEGSCDFLGLNGWKREWQNCIIGHAGVAFAVQGDGVGFATESYAASALYTTLASLSCALSRIRRVNSLILLDVNWRWRENV